MTKKTTPAKKTAAKKVAAKKVAAAAPADRSAAIAASWQDKKVAAARNKKDKVKVGGEIYRSVPAAFEALGLAMGPMIGFRMKLKAAGKAVHEGKTFTIVKSAE